MKTCFVKHTVFWNDNDWEVLKSGSPVNHNVFSTKPPPYCGMRSFKNKLRDLYFALV